VREPKALGKYRRVKGRGLGLVSIERVTLPMAVIVDLPMGNASGTWLRSAFGLVADMNDSNGYFSVGPSVARQRGSCPLRSTIDPQELCRFRDLASQGFASFKISGIKETFFVIANAAMTARFRTPAMAANKNASV
jgi:hypothetical protein